MKQNEAQYDLDRKAAKTSALSSNNLDKYQYLTGDDLGLKPSTIEQAKFEYSPLDNIFNKGLAEDYKKEGLFKRLKNIENAQKNLTRGDVNESIYYTPISQVDSEHDKDEDKKKKNNNNIDTKPLNVFDYLKRLSQEVEDLMDKIKDADNDINIYKFVFIGNNREKLSFNTLRKPLNFLSAIYNGEITLKEAEISQRKLEKKIEELKYSYKPENAGEKEEIDRVLMHANDMLEYRDKIIEASRDGTFSSEHLRKSDDAAHNYVLTGVEKFIQKIKSMAENINLSLFEYFFES